MYRSEIQIHNLQYLRNGKNLKICCKRNLSISRSHYPERASALDFKDTSAPRFGHSDVVFDLFLETRFLHLIALLSNFCKLFWLFRNHFTNMVLLQVKNTTNSVYQAFLLIIERRHVLMFVTKNTQKLHHYDQIAERRRLWSLSQMLSPGISSVFFQFFQFNRNLIEIGLSAHFFASWKGVWGPILVQTKPLIFGIFITPAWTINKTRLIILLA